MSVLYLCIRRSIYHTHFLKSCFIHTFWSSYISVWKAFSSSFLSHSIPCSDSPWVISVVPLGTYGLFPVFALLKDAVMLCMYVIHTYTILYDTDFWIWHWQVRVIGYVILIIVAKLPSIQFNQLSMHWQFGKKVWSPLINLKWKMVLGRVSFYFAYSFSCMNLSSFIV